MSFSTFLALSFSLCAKFLSRIAFTALIGYYLDNFMGTSPWIMIVFALLGCYFGHLALVKIDIKKRTDA